MGAFFMANAVTKIRHLFADLDKKLTLTQIKEHLPELKASEITMALCYLQRQRYVTRELTPSTSKYGRKNINLYNYSSIRLPAPDKAEPCELP